jgi:tyrosyl-tRNA synthetase
MYGKTMSIPDEQIAPWYSLLLGEEPSAGAGAGPRDAKRALARALVARFHSPAAAAEAEAAFDLMFIDRELPEDIEVVEIAAEDGEVHLPAAIATAFGRSRSEARRMLAQGGVRLDKEPLAPDALDLPSGELDGRVLQLGKRHFRRLRIV